MNHPEKPSLCHFSENPDIELFEPHVARTATEKEPLVWAIDEEHAPSFWFPRECPRACCWRSRGPLSPAGAALIGQGGANRLHAIEAGWLERMRDCRLFLYRFDPQPFSSHLDEAGYWTTREAVRPLSVEPVGDLLECHADANIEFRIVLDLWPIMDAIVASGLAFSIIRKANALPRRVAAD